MRQYEHIIISVNEIIVNIEKFIWNFIRNLIHLHKISLYIEQYQSDWIVRGKFTTNSRKIPYLYKNLKRNSAFVQHSQNSTMNMTQLCKKFNWTILLIKWLRSIQLQFKSCEYDVYNMRKIDDFIRIYGSLKNKISVQYLLKKGASGQKLASNLIAESE